MYDQGGKSWIKRIFGAISDLAAFTGRNGGCNRRRNPFHQKELVETPSSFLASALDRLCSYPKVVFQRPRPKTEMFVFSYSFPSGHVFSATVLYGFCIYLTFRFINNPVIKWTVSALLVLLILLIGFSRIYLGVHWLSDTSAGM